MKNNLFKTVAVVATAVALLATSVTSFAATATTVTTYNEDLGKPHVVSTVSDVEAGVMVTYLASAKADGSVSEKDDIVYIDQKTSDGSQMTFSYDALKSSTAKILYGSSLSDVATALNADANRTVEVGNVTINGLPVGADTTVFGADGVETETLGNSEDGTLIIQLNDSRYEVTSVTVDGKKLETIPAAIPVKGNSIVDVDVDFVVGDVDDVDSATYFVNEESDDDNGSVTLYTVGLVCKINGGFKEGYTYGVYAEKNNQPFELDANQETTGGYYPAVVNNDDYYAVQLASHVEADLEGVTLVPYYNNGTGNIICR